MKTKTKVLILFALSLVGLAIGYVFIHNYEFGLCKADEVARTYDAMCHIQFEQIGNSLYYGMMALAGVFFALLLVPQAFNAWKKFAIWYVPLAAIIFATYELPGSGDLFSPYPEDIFRWGSIAYVAVSAIIIALQYTKHKR